MYAVIQVGNFQFKVSEGDVINTQLMDEKEGSSVTLDKVLLFAKGNDIRVGQPFLKDVKVTAKILKETKAKKVFAFKFRKRKDSKTKVGHRQGLTALSILQISA